MVRRRFEVPSWLFLVLMTATLAVAVWAVAREQIIDLVGRWV